MNSGFGQNVVEPPIESRFRNSIEQLERIGESHADRVIAKFRDETIIMAPATAKALTFESEGHAGNAYDDVSELCTLGGICRLRRFQRVSRLRRLEDSKGAALKLGATANASCDDSAPLCIDTRIEDRAAGA